MTKVYLLIYRINSPTYHLANTRGNLKGRLNKHTCQNVQTYHSTSYIGRKLCYSTLSQNSKSGQKCKGLYPIEQVNETMFLGVIDSE